MDLRSITPRSPSLIPLEEGQPQNMEELRVTQVHLSRDVFCRLSSNLVTHIPMKRVASRMPWTPQPAALPAPPASLHGCLSSSVSLVWLNSHAWLGL